MNSIRPLILPITAALVLALSACSAEKTANEPNRKAATTPDEGAPSAKDHAEEGEAGHAEDGDHEGEVEHAEEGETAEPIRMDAAALAAAGIRLAKLNQDSLNEELRAPGEVVDNAYGTTLITPRVEALVVRRHARLGEDVAAGAPLVTLSSVEVAQAQGALAIAEQDWKRVQSLGRDAVSGRRFQESQVTVEQARATARAYGLPGTAAGSSNGEFTLTAPHAGRLTEDSFVVGERIEPGRTLFRLVDEAVVWVDATLPADQARRIAVGSNAQVVLGKTRLDGKVTQRAHRTSDNTRTALVRIEVANEDDRLHGGDYVEVYLDAGRGSAPQLAVPTQALLQLEGESVVFRQAEDGSIAPVAVRAGAVVGDRTVIEDGLSIGDTVVVEGAYVLKSQMLKAQLGEGHAH